MGKVAAVIGVVALNVAAVATGNPYLASLAIKADVAAVSAAVVAGASAAFNALAAPKTGQTAAGTQVSWQADPSAPVPYLMGRTALAGILQIEGTNSCPPSTSSWSATALTSSPTRRSTTPQA